jgi:outer membrane protein OmpA-like peptidoglycan-associated protein
MIIEKRCNGVLLFTFLILFFLLCGCGKKTTIVLLPDPDGKVGHVTVSTEAGSTDITKEREATVVKGRESLPTSPKILSEAAIKADFSQVLAILPGQPVHFILYFDRESTRLTADSTKSLPKIVEMIDSRKSRNISVIGHTDTAGNLRYNLQLSRNRAAAVKRILIQKGVDSAYIKSTSHGEENPLIKTGNNVHEPRNRRVEVVVR